MQKMKRWNAISMMFVVFLFATTKTFAIGDGPRAYWAAPKDSNVLIPMYMGIQSNFGFNDSLVVKDAEFDTDILALMYTRTLSVGGNLSGISFILPTGQVDGGFPDTAIQGKSSGLGDLTVMGVFSLFGAPAHSLKTFASYKPKTIFDLLLFATIPIGEYDSNKVVNLGTNRWSLRFGTPIMHFFRSGSGKNMSFEILPSVTYFTDNNDPSGASSQLEQQAIYKVESHYTHDFNRTLWGSIDALYTSGGETTVDGVNKNNSQRSLGAGITLGINFSPTTSMTASYGTIVDRNENSQNGELLRMTFKYVY